MSLMIHITINILITLLGTALYLAARRKDLLRIGEMRSEFAEAIRELVTWSERAYKDLSREIKQIQDQLAEPARPDDVQTSFNNLDKRSHVIALAEKGLDLDEISQKLNVPKGEAELIINLKKYKKA
jgi:hypothetical protein